MLHGGYGGSCTCYVEWPEWTQVIEDACQGYSDCHACELALWQAYPGALSVGCE